MRAASQAVRCVPVRAHLMMLVLATAVPLFSFSAYLVYSSDAQRRDSADIAAVNVAHRVASATVEFLRNSDALLTRLAGSTTVTADGLICERELNDLVVCPFEKVRQRFVL